MTDQTVTPPPPADPPAASPLLAAAQPRPGRTLPVPLWLAGALAGFALGAATVGTIWALSSGTSSAPSEASGGSFTLIGSMALASGAIDTKTGGCTGGSGYTDIRTGAAVTVYDESGKVLATGELGTSTPKGKSGCTFGVSVPNVPKGPKFYQVEVSHRGKVNLSSDEAEAGLFGASLG